MYLLGVIKRDWIFPVLCSFVVVTLFSFTTSWLYDRPFMIDSAVFQLIGKNWAEGRIPYKDLWELKGPLIFLPNALGYWLLGSKMGVYIIQIINLSIALYFVRKTFLLEYNKKVSTLLTYLVVLYFCVFYETGNTVEEYLLPLLIYAFNLLYRYIDKCIEKKEYDLPGGYAFVFGTVLGFSLMSRLTNAISICAAILVIGFLLIYKGKWCNLLKSFLCFIAGFFVLTLPFVIYFYSKDALEEMWYGTFLYGLEYAEHSGFNLLSLHGMRHIILRFVNCYFLLLVAFLIIKYNPRRKLAGIVWLVISVMTILLFLRLNSFGHYFIITVPFIPIIFIEIHKIWKSMMASWNFTLLRVVAVIYIILGVIGVTNNIRNFFLVYHDYEELAVYEKIVKKLPPNFRSSFIAYDCDPELYLYLDIPPKYPYYAGQSFMIIYGASIKPKIEACFRDGNAEWLLVQGTPCDWLQRIIVDKYSFLFSEKSSRWGELMVYKHR